MAKFGFDVTEVEVSERGDFEVIPKGTEVTMKCTEAELKETSAKTGHYLACVFEITKGEYVNRKVWQNFNISNPSEKAEKIGREQVAGWARACGKPNAKDSDDLLERPFQCKLDIEKGTVGYGDRNKIGSFLTPGSESKAASKPAAPASKGKFDEEEAPAPKAKPAPEPESEEKSAAPATGGKKNPWD
jgi:hypothetical protein